MYYKLMPEDLIKQGMTLMSGTPEGVIFTGPTRCDIASGIKKHIKSGDIFGGSLVDGIIEEFIRQELESRHFLQHSDQVLYTSSSMGKVSVIVQ